MFGKIGLRIIDDTFHIGSNLCFCLLIQYSCSLLQIIHEVRRKRKIHIVQIVNHCLKGFLLFRTLYGLIKKPRKMETEIISVVTWKGVGQPDQNGLFRFDNIQLLSDSIPVLCICKAAQKRKLFLRYIQKGSFLLYRQPQRSLCALGENCADGLYG